MNNENVLKLLAEIERLCDAHPGWLAVQIKARLKQAAPAVEMAEQQAERGRPVADTGG